LIRTLIRAENKMLTWDQRPCLCSRIST